MNDTKARDTLSRLADHLHSSRERLLRAWRARVASDHNVTTDATLARTQFYDHIPRILDAFERQLREGNAVPQSSTAQAQREGAAEHGMHRWVHGYHYTEVMREWGHLHTCLAAEVEAFAMTQPQLDAAGMAAARQSLTQLFVECMVGSAAEHVRLQEAEAASRLRDLELVLDNVRALERERVALWHEAAHDLRGNVGAVQMAATALAATRDRQLPGRPDPIEVVSRTASALTSLLDDLIELSRLEAGHERRKLSTLDLPPLIREVCNAFEPLAANRGLFLKVDVPPTLTVETDAVKVRRIVQNLLINALKYTEAGGAVVSVTDSTVANKPSWELRVQDTGVGMTERASPAITQVLRIATAEAAVISPSEDFSAETLPSLSTHAPPSSSGEGVGLTIVKKLCELLDATIEVATAPGRGTTFRIVFPSRYPTSAQ